MPNDSGIDFQRSKIYEKLDYQPQPPNYNKKIPWVIQQQIAATNGMHYVDSIGKLDEYPIPNLPVTKVKSGIMLDIGSGWGRWLVAGARKGYIPVGVDIRLEFCRTARAVAKELGYNCYSIVADLKDLPFKPDTFDLVWSFSAIQHVHKERFLDCLNHINRILNNYGFCLLQFPNKNGVRNRFVRVRQPDDYNSWDVRYYSIDEYKVIFESIFGNFSYRNHSFLGIGILPSDLKYVSAKNKIIVAVSVFMSFLTQIFPPMKKISDSIYIKAFKKSKINKDKNSAEVGKFIKAHTINPQDNSNIRYLICCPVSGGDLVLNKEKTELISQAAGLAFPIVDEIPILIPSQARKL